MLVTFDLNDDKPLSSVSHKNKKNAGQMLAAAVTAKVEHINLPSG